MTTLARKRTNAGRGKKGPTFVRSFVPTTALAKKVKFDERMMHITLIDGRVLGVPLIWFPTLYKASPAERKRCEIGGGGI